MELPQNTVAIKQALGGWGREASDLVTPALDAKGLINDRSLLFPLSTTRSAIKSRLLAVATAIVRKHPCDSNSLPLHGEMDASLQSLFFHLNDAGREELRRRAIQWPTELGNRVRRVPLSTQPLMIESN
jgi:hypothetical protein